MGTQALKPYIAIMDKTLKNLTTRVICKKTDVVVIDGRRCLFSIYSK